jgi:hypothetical protein
MAEIDPATLEAARQIVAAAENQQRISTATGQNERLEQALEMALARTQGEPNQTEAAANLFERWCEQNSDMRDLLRPLIREAIEARLQKIPRAEPEVA